MSIEIQVQFVGRLGNRSRHFSNLLEDAITGVGLSEYNGICPFYQVGICISNIYVGS